MGEALYLLMLESGMYMGNLLDMLDEAGEGTLLKVDKMLSRTGLIIRIIDNDLLMRLAARLLDYRRVRAATVNLIYRVLSKAVSSEDDEIGAAS
jgi:hypothetical protein